MYFHSKNEIRYDVVRDYAERGFIRTVVLFQHSQNILLVAEARQIRKNLPKKIHTLKIIPEAIFKRIDKPEGTDAIKDGKSKQGYPLRDDGGTVGEVKTDKLPGQ